MKPTTNDDVAGKSHNRSNGIHAVHLAPGKIIATSGVMQQVFKSIKITSRGDANVLITGESGVGKELVAQHIHYRSMRSKGPLVAINCGALPATLFESELFGYEKGAFTGALRDRPGLVEVADGGTLFLDEICEMPPHLQVKLLRVLEERKVRRVGSKVLRPVDIRVVSATNRNIEEALVSGVLREDLYFRISALHINVPSLRKRREDIPLLCHHFLKGLEEKYQRGITSIDVAALSRMQEYDWPGNVRELQNVVEQAYYSAMPPKVLPEHLSFRFMHKRRAPDQNEVNHLPFREAKERTIEKFERMYLKFHLENNKWNVTQTAAACGIDRRTIQRFIKKYDLKS